MEAQYYRQHFKLELFRRLLVPIAVFAPNQAPRAEVLFTRVAHQALIQPDCVLRIGIRPSHNVERNVPEGVNRDGFVAKKT